MSARRRDPCLPARFGTADLPGLADEAGPDAAAHDAVAANLGFADWAALVREVGRRETLNRRDPAEVERMLAADPALATGPMTHWCDHSEVAPLNYIAMMGFDAGRLGLPANLTGTGPVARALIDAGALVDGAPDEQETPLITAASYGDAEVAAVLIERGADVDRLAKPTSGGVAGGSALLHAAVFGMTDVLDLVVGAGAQVRTLVEGAASGDIAAWPLEGEGELERLLALIMAAVHERLDVIDALLDAGTPIDAVDPEWQRQALRAAAEHGRPASVRRLLARGADPNLRDADGHTALDLTRPEHASQHGPEHDAVALILRPLTTQ
jgi:ankyrin repeat protein